jgi:hypothetical protein
MVLHEGVVRYLAAIHKLPEAEHEGPQVLLV